MNKTPMEINENDAGASQGLRIIGQKNTNTGFVVTDKSNDCPRVNPVFPNELAAALDGNKDMLELFDALVESEGIKFMAGALNRILHEIRTSPNPKETTIIIGWSFGCNPPGLSTWEEVLTWLNSRGMKRSRAWLYLERERITKLIKE